MAAARSIHLARAARAVLFLPSRPPLPIRLQVENTNRCNLRCIMCGRQFRKPFNRDMPDELFVKLVSEVRPAYLTINGDGEPLLDPGLENKIRLAKRLGCIVSLPTNMTLMDESRARQLLATGLNLLTVSLDGARRETYEAIRVGAKFSEVIANTRTFMALMQQQRDPPPPELRVLLVLQELNLHDYEAALALQRDLGLKIQLVPVKYLDRKEVAERCAGSAEAFSRLTSDLGRTQKEDTSPDAQELYARWLRVAEKACHPAGPGRACLRPWTTAYVDARGDVYPCCLAVDPQKSLKMGNIQAQSFKSIWHGEAYQRYRTSMLESRHSLPVCAGCPAGDEGQIARFRRWFRWFPASLHHAWPENMEPPARATTEEPPDS